MYRRVMMIEGEDEDRAQRDDERGSREAPSSLLEAPEEGKEEKLVESLPRIAVHT